MVLVTELSEGRRAGVAVAEDDDGFVTDSGSEGGSDDMVGDPEEVELELEEDEEALVSFDPASETLADRFYALKDMLSPTTRNRLVQASSVATVYGRKGLSFAGNSAWVIVTSAILLGLPLALAVEGETMFVQQERFEKEQMSGQQMMLPNGQPQSQPQGIVPPGF